MMYILNIEEVLEKMMVKDLKEFTFVNYYKWIGFTKKDSYYLLEGGRGGGQALKRFSITCY